MKKISAIFLAISIIFSQKSFAMVPLSGGSTQIEGVGNTMLYIQLINSVATVAIKGDQEGAKQLAYTLGASAAITEIGKKTLNNVHIAGNRLGERPNGGDFNFPSGHTSWTTANAWFMYKRYGIKYAALPIAGAAFTAYSRIEAKKHDIKGVTAGALVGILSAEYFTTNFNQKNLKVAFIPTVENGRTGAMLNLSYSY
jgi:membrane-associated phospholipid phosphatase